MVNVERINNPANMALNLLEEKGFLYEINEKGEKTLVRSSDSTHRAYLRFTNKTSRPVNVWWRDFRGIRHHYLFLHPGAFSDINSFVTHPWEFTDLATEERFAINNCVLYRAPPKLGGMLFRTNWNITVTVRSLRYSALLAIAEQIRSAGLVKELGLPKVLEAELEKLVQKVQMEANQQAQADM